MQEGLTLDEASVSLVNQTVPYSATSAKSISFKSPDVWVAEVKDAAWLTVSPAYGGAGNYTLNITLQVNTAKQSRQGTVIITCRSKTTEIVITQEAVPEMTIDESSQALLTQTVAYNATTAQSISFDAPFAWTATVKDAPWLKVTPSSGQAGKVTLQFELEQNWEVTSRTGKVNIVCSDKNVEVVITQEGAPEWAAPTTTRYVKTIAMQYKENIKANARIKGSSFTIAYDSKKRVRSVTASDGIVQTYEYSNGRQILLKIGDYVQTVTIGSDGLVDQLSATEPYGNIVAMTYHFQRSDGVISKIIGDTSISLGYSNGKLVTITYTGENLNVPYKYNHRLPAINLELNAYLFATGEQLISPMWLGYCGKMGDYLMEYPMFSYAIEANPDTSNLPLLGDISNVEVEKDSGGYFTKITYYWDVVNKSGTKVGTNEVIYTITYID